MFFYAQLLGSSILLLKSVKLVAIYYLRVSFQGGRLLIGVYITANADHRIAIGTYYLKSLTLSMQVSRLVCVSGRLQ